MAVEMTDKVFAGDFAGAAALQCKMLPLIDALFSQVNPIPVKAAMHHMGFCENYLRLPLVPMEAPQEQVLLENMKDVGIYV